MSDSIEPTPETRSSAPGIERAVRRMVEEGMLGRDDVPSATRILNEETHSADLAAELARIAFWTDTDLFTDHPAYQEHIENLQGAVVRALDAGSVLDRVGGLRKILREIGSPGEEDLDEHQNELAAWVRRTLIQMDEVHDRGKVLEDLARQFPSDALHSLRELSDRHLSELAPTDLKALLTCPEPSIRRAAVEALPKITAEESREERAAERKSRPRTP